MASTIATACPKCEKTIKAPADLEGKKIRCKDCQHVFIVKRPDEEDDIVEVQPAQAAPAPAKGPVKVAAKMAPAKPKKKGDDDEENSNPYGVTTTDFLPRCPFCAKELDEETQVICLHCGYNMRTRERIHSRKTYETTGLDYFLWLLPGIACAIASLIMIGLMVVYWAVFPRLHKDFEADWYSFLFGLPFRLWFSVMTLFALYFFARFAIKRLAFNYTPPEKIKYK